MRFSTARGGQRHSSPAILFGVCVATVAALAWLRTRTAPPPCAAPNKVCAVPRFSDTGWSPHAGASAARVAIIALAREGDASDLACTLHSFDAAYNGQRKYPYVIMSEEPWSPSARALLSASTDARVDFVVLPPSAWSLPENSFLPSRDNDAPQRYYGDTIAYRKMCRFFSGPIFTLPVLASFDYYWRLDAHVRYVCDIEDAEDPVALLERTKGTYAFGVVMQEQMQTVPSLWSLAADFARRHNATAALRSWDRSGAGVWTRGCHFWSNFEVGSLAFFRGAAYQEWFAAADAAGGFAQERWGDAPIHTLGLMMLAPRSSVHYLPELGYQHPPNFRCPRTAGACKRRGVPVPCKGDPFAGCTWDISDGIQHREGCDLDNMLL
jgi:alpha 1,2-mannosyltransferase